MSIHLQAIFLVCNFLSDEIDTVLYGLEHPETQVFPDIDTYLDEMNEEFDAILAAIA
jgi:hypothetical protein